MLALRSLDGISNVAFAVRRKQHRHEAVFPSVGESLVPRSQVFSSAGPANMYSGADLYACRRA
jgi:hypothetical protein